MKQSFVRDNAWLCPVATIVLAGLILLVFGITWWDALLVVAMLACPLSWLWIFVFGRIPGEASVSCNSADKSAAQEPDKHLMTSEAERSQRSAE